MVIYFCFSPFIAVVKNCIILLQGDSERQLSLGDSLIEEESLEDELDHHFPNVSGMQFCSTPKKTLTCVGKSKSLGLSLLEDEVLCMTELGTSLLAEEHGLDDELDVMLEKDVDYEIADLGTSLVDTDPDSDDVFDPDFICNVQSTPKPMPAFVSPEIGEKIILFMTI